MDSRLAFDAAIMKLSLPSALSLPVSLIISTLHIYHHC